MNLRNVRFQQGDVGALPFENDSFDLVLSLNGFHAFPDKEASYEQDVPDEQIKTRIERHGYTVTEIL